MIIYKESSLNIPPVNNPIENNPVLSSLLNPISNPLGQPLFYGFGNQSLIKNDRRSRI